LNLESKIWWSFIYINLTLVSLQFLPIDVNSFRQTTFRVGLQSLKNQNEIAIKTRKKGLLKADHLYFTYYPNNQFTIGIDRNLLVLNYNKSIIGKFREINFLNADTVIELTTKNGIKRLIDGYLNLKLSNGANSVISITAMIPEDKYLTDVLCTEAGMGQPQEYYRVQAIISRTYAYNNALRHARSGYNYCDKQHCQVYNGYCDNKPAQNSVVASRGLVITDKKDKLITSAYHANCGGNTCNSEDVWETQRSYFKAVHDRFCGDESKAEWQRVISKKEWISYLEKISGQSIEPAHADFSSQNPNGEPVYHYKSISIKYAKIQDAFRLKSNWFSIEDRGHELVLIGRGMGHRVGLCQQGARIMTMNGYNHKEVIKKYFSDVMIQNYKELIMKNLKN